MADNFHDKNTSAPVGKEIELPEFTAKDSDESFSTAEFFFETFKITSIEKKINILTKNSKEGHNLSATDIVSRYLKQLDIGDRKPSEFLYYLQKLGNSFIPETTLYEIWVDGLPPTAKSFMSTRIFKGTLDESAKLADYWTTPKGETVSTQTEETDNSFQLNNIQATLKSLYEEVLSLKSEMQFIKTELQLCSRLKRRFNITLPSDFKSPIAFSLPDITVFKGQDKPKENKPEEIESKLMSLVSNLPADSLTIKALPKEPSANSNHSTPSEKSAAKFVKSEESVVSTTSSTLSEVAPKAKSDNPKESVVSAIPSTVSEQPATKSDQPSKAIPSDITAERDTDSSEKTQSEERSLPKDASSQATPFEPVVTALSIFNNSNIFQFYAQSSISPEKITEAISKPSTPREQKEIKPTTPSTPTERKASNSRPVTPMKPFEFKNKAIPMIIQFSPQNKSKSASQGTQSTSNESSKAAVLCLLNPTNKAQPLPLTISASSKVTAGALFSPTIPAPHHATTVSMPKTYEATTWAELKDYKGNRSAVGPCWYHNKFKDAALRCLPPCSYSEDRIISKK